MAAPSLSKTRKMRRRSPRRHISPSSRIGAQYARLVSNNSYLNPQRETPRPPSHTSAASSDDTATNLPNLVPNINMCYEGKPAGICGSLAPTCARCGDALRGGAGEYLNGENLPSLSRALPERLSGNRHRHPHVRGLDTTLSAAVFIPTDRHHTATLATPPAHAPLQPIVCFPLPVLAGPAAGASRISHGTHTAAHHQSQQLSARSSLPELPAPPPHGHLT